MLLAHDSDYAGVVALIKAATKPIVCYYDDAPSNFLIYAPFEDGNIGAIISGGYTSKPGTFDADFPDAIELIGSGLGITP